MDNGFLNIFAGNARSIHNKLEEFSQNIKRFDIGIVVEAWINKNVKRINIPNYESKWLPRNHQQGGGIIVFYNKNLFVEEVGNIIYSFENIELFGIKVKGIHENMFIFICYRAPNRANSQGDWQHIFNIIGRNHPQFLLMGDFNAHNMTWGCEKNDSNGNNLYEALVENDLFVLNDKTKSYVGGSGSVPSNLDLVIGTDFRMDKCVAYQLDDSWDSDHLPIGVKVHFAPSCLTYRCNKLSSIKTNWNDYYTYLREKESFFSDPSYFLLPTVD